MVTDTHCETAEINFQGKHARETFQFFFYQHWIRLLWPIAKLFAKTALLISVGYAIFFFYGVEDNFSRRFTVELFSLLFFLAYYDFLIRLYRYFLRVTVITDKKVHRIKKSLLVIDDHQSIDLWMLQDIDRCQHSIPENILCYGTLTLEAQESVLNLHYVPHITRNYERIIHLREQAREHMTAYGAVRTRKNNEQQPVFGKRKGVVTR